MNPLLQLLISDYSKIIIKLWYYGNWRTDKEARTGNGGYQMRNLTIHSLVEGYKTKQFSPVEVTAYYLDRIEAEKDLNAYITVAAEQSLAQAKLAEQKMMVGVGLGKLEGVPVSYKDNLYTEGVRATSGSSIDQEFIPNRNSGVVKKLERAGAINLGKTNMHEYAFGITSNNPFYGAVKNPWNREFTPGGSSGGSGAAVAADLCAMSIGTDTGGSIRIPAAACGIIGLKATNGHIDGSDISNLSWTLDHVGPLTKNVSDLAITMEALTNESYESALNEDIRGMRIGVPKNYFNERIDGKILDLYDKALKNLEELGAVLLEVDIPFVEEDLSVIYTLATAEAGYIHHDHIQTRLEDFGVDVRQVLASSKSIQAYDYIQALKKAGKVKAQFTQLFSEIDVLATPTMAAMSQHIGVEEVDFGSQKEDIFNAMIRYPSVFNMTGHPALSIPCGQKGDLPVGLSLVGAHYTEKRLIRVAYAYERNFLSGFYAMRDNLNLQPAK